MRLVDSLRFRVKAIFRRSRVNSEIDEELRSHIAIHADELERAGVPRAEAERRARIEFGGQARFQEECHEALGGHFIETLLRDVRFGLRMLRKNPGFTTIAVLTLALGIGANTAIFCMLNGVLLRELPYRQPQQLYVVSEDVPQFNAHVPFAPYFPVNAGNFLRWQGLCPAISSMALVGQYTLNMAGEGIPRQVNALRVSSAFFSVMDIRPQVGRTFLPEEDQLGRDHEVILTNRFWQGAFNSDPGIVGRSIRLDNDLYTVVGIMPASFRLPELPQLSSFTPDLFKPFGFQPWDLWPGLGGFNYSVLARLHPGADSQQALAQLNVVEARIGREGDARRHVSPGEFDLRASLRPLKTVVVGPAQRALWMLMIAAGFVLLIICVNLAGLMLARNLDRAHEVAIRTALGATARRLMRQFLLEGAILTAVGGTLGVLLASLGLRYLIRYAPLGIPRVGEIQIDPGVLLFTTGAAMACALLFALLPAFRLSKTGPVEALKISAPTATGARETVRVRSALVAGQIALCSVLIAGALLLVESLRHVSRANQWMDEQRVLSIELAPPPGEFRTTQQADQFFSKLLEKIRNLPGVESAGVSSKLPLLGMAFVDGIDFREARQPPERHETGQFRFVSPGYFQTVGLPLVAGRWLSEADRGKDVALISESVARKLLPGRNPIGMHLLWAQLAPLTPHEIVGVVGDVRTASDGPAVPTVYLPLWTFYQLPSTLVVRSRIDAAGLGKSISSAVWSVNPRVGISQERTLAAIVTSSEATRRYETALGAVFSIFALLIAALGLYGVVSYSVGQRTHEIGIRMALGAQRRDVLREVLGAGGRMALVGIALGLAAAFGLTRLMSAMLFGVSATDPITFAAVVLILLAVALAACWIPARRAMRVDPMVALRHE